MSDTSITGKFKKVKMKLFYNWETVVHSISMKVLLINGSPRKNGCTNAALEEVAKALKKNDVESEIFWIGNKAIQGCTACLACKKGKCPYDDGVDKVVELAKNCDGFVFGTPVYFAGANGSMHAFMDRLFFAYKEIFKGKPAACVVSARRAGTTAALDNLNKYPLFNQMPIVSANYWNAVHGSTPEQVAQDIEGLQTMRILGDNMAWMLKVIKKAGIPFPKSEDKIYTNFIR